MTTSLKSGAYSPPCLRIRIPPIIQMHQNLRLGTHIALLNPITRTLQQPRHHLRPIAIRQPPRIPQQPRRDLIPNTHERKLNPIRRKAIHNIIRILPHLRNQRISRQARPGRRRSLMRWIRPRIAVVKIKIYLQAGSLRALRELDVVIEVVVSVRWVHPDALADGVYARGFKDGFERLDLRGDVLVCAAGFFLDEEGGPVYASVLEGCEAGHGEERGEECGEERGGAHGGYGRSRQLRGAGMASSTSIPHMGYSSPINMFHAYRYHSELRAGSGDVI